MIQQDLNTFDAPLYCDLCGEEVRLFGIEPTGAGDRTILRTYVCPGCDAVQTQFVPAPSEIEKFACAVVDLTRRHEELIEVIQHTPGSSTIITDEIVELAVEVENMRDARKRATTWARQLAQYMRTLSEMENLEDVAMERLSAANDALKRVLDSLEAT